MSGLSYADHTIRTALSRSILSMAIQPVPENCLAYGGHALELATSPAQHAWPICLAGGLQYGRADVCSNATALAARALVIHPRPIVECYMCPYETKVIAFIITPCSVQNLGRSPDKQKYKIAECKQTHLDSTGMYDALSTPVHADYGYKAVKPIPYVKSPYVR